MGQINFPIPVVKIIGTPCDIVKINPVVIIHIPAAFTDSGPHTGIHIEAVIEIQRGGQTGVDNIGQIPNQLTEIIAIGTAHSLSAFIPCIVDDLPGLTLQISEGGLQGKAKRISLSQDCPFKALQGLYLQAGDDKYKNQQ